MTISRGHGRRPASAGMRGSSVGMSIKRTIGTVFEFPQRRAAEKALLSLQHLVSLQEDGAIESMIVSAWEYLPRRIESQSLYSRC